MSKSKNKKVPVTIIIDCSSPIKVNVIKGTTLRQLIIFLKKKKIQ